MSDNTTPDTSSVAPGGSRLRPLLIALAVAVPVAAAGLFGWLWQGPQAGRELGEQNLLGLDLARPDVLIESASLSRLPKDLLAVPLLRDTLTEDLVFYYEANADRLGLTGSLRRIIYEHDLQLRDNLLDELLDQPAEVALWRDAGGRLKHFLVVIERGGLAKALEPLAKVALDDSQLSQAGEFIVDGAPVPFYRLRYNNDRSLLFASHGDQLLLLSSADMLFAPEPEPEPASAEAASADDQSEVAAVDPDAAVPADEAAAESVEPEEPSGPLLAKVSTEAVEALLAGQHPFPERFGLETRGPLQQRISLSSDFLALGYQRFIPAFAGLRFEMDGQGWHSFLALNEVEDQGKFDFTPVWRAMPMGASACVALPVAAAVPGRLLSKVGAEAKVAAELGAQLSGTAGLCWYAESRLHSPLLVGTLKGEAGAQTDAELGKLFDSLIGAWEANVEGGQFPVEDSEQGATHTWQRQVGSNFGQYPGGDAENPDALAASGFFRVSLARHGSTLLFSLDDRLVNKALDTLDKRFPPLADVLPKDALVPAYLAPQTLATLFERETLESLPEDMEPVFRNAAQSNLLPKLRALSTHGKYALTLPAGSEASSAWQWLPLQWRAL
ncbi:DUF2138 domain-containing protein [Aquipseudomonas ullengensis]|uniref:DUF2138 domain-containing protein n=1 Tax=Aquipseudomonas ullengensis TaxID=2759166 RepID=A0A7W4LLP2_9GAMM|nr:DUF2138 domain-containing protein [Pseudomonas ullengensis]MBB2495471.1 DUF2138 domain-containing protein [Pseudomonas ullengensis]